MKRSIYLHTLIHGDNSYRITQYYIGVVSENDHGSVSEHILLDGIYSSAYETLKPEWQKYYVYLDGRGYFLSSKAIESARKGVFL